MLALLKKIKAKLLQTKSQFFPKETIKQSKIKWNNLAKENAQFHVLTKGKGAEDIKAFREEGGVDVEKYVLSDLYLKDKLPPFNTLSALEIGCGIGRLTEFLAGSFRQVTGVDISEEMIKKAKIRLEAINNVNFVSADGTKFPFESNSFDFAFSFIVFQHMPSVEVIGQNLKEITRVLKRGGIAKIQVRGTPIAKNSLYYGPHFDNASIKNLFREIPATLLKTEGEGQKYFWIYFSKV